MTDPITTPCLECGLMPEDCRCPTLQWDDWIDREMEMEDAETWKRLTRDGVGS